MISYKQFFFIVIHCNTKEILKNKCPSSTKCVEPQPGSFEGVCHCKDNGFMFNKKYTNDNDYCISIDKNINQHTQINRNSQINRNPQQEINIKTSARSNHIITDVLLPIILFLIVIGVFFFAIKKIKITNRNRPFFCEDVILGANDSDDSPLIQAILFVMHFEKKTYSNCAISNYHSTIDITIG